ncbi:MAG: hypothetical protein ACJ76J_06880 [Thermoanaerobaculia bacterium]
MRRILLCALFAALPALPAGAQILGIQGVLVEPRHPTPSDRIRLTVVGVESCSLTFKEPNYLESWGWAEIHIVPGKDCGKVPNPVYREFRHTAEIGPLPAGLHVAQIWVDNYYYPNPDLNWREIFEVGEDDGQLHLGQGGDFQASIHWSNPHDGSSGTGHARRLAQDSGAFWFFSPDNLEVTLKILDGRAINGRWWVFIASMTDLQFEVEISRAGGPAKTYVQTAGANRNFIDVDASFEEGPPQPVCGPLQWSPEIILDPERPTAADPVHVEVAVCNPWPTLTYDGMEGNHILFNDVSWGWPSGGEPPPPNLRFTAETTAGPLAPGIYAVDFRMDKEHLFGRTFEVTQPSSQLRLRDTADSSFNVYVNLDSQPRGVGHGVPLTSESGYFWFFDPDNVELTVKILDGRAVNGKYWVFLSSMTDVAFTVEVEHCPDYAEPPVCTSQIYRSVQGVNRNFIDVDFPGSL